MHFVVLDIRGLLPVYLVVVTLKSTEIKLKLSGTLKLNFKRRICRVNEPFGFSFGNATASSVGYKVVEGIMHIVVMIEDFPWSLDIN